MKSTQLTDDERNYELDVERTFIASFPAIIGFVVTIFYIVAWRNILDAFTIPEMVLIATFVYAYSILRMMGLLFTHITLCFKPRVEKENAEETGIEEDK